MNIDEKYDNISKTELEKRLKRSASKAELANSDTDPDLAIETIWQLLKEMESRIQKLEKSGIIK